jgi:thiamine transport system substrate-binding protein
MKILGKIMILSLLGFGVLTGCVSKPEEGPGVRVLTYSSLGGKGGFLDGVAEEFLQKTGCALRIETTPGALQVLSYLEEPVQRERLDVLMGVDEILFERARPYLLEVDLIGASDAARFEPLLRQRIRKGFLPVDYGALTFIYRKQGEGAIPKPPVRLKDLLKPEFKKKWIVQDPRASSPGLLFFMFAEGRIGVPELSKTWLSLAPGWDTSYKMFLSGEVPMVWSYLSSLAYHASKGEQDRYGHVRLEEGFPLQVEGLGVVNRAGNPLEQNPCIRKWIAFVLDPATQARLVEKQWMMPVISGTALPGPFKNLPPVDRAAGFTRELKDVERILSRFGRDVRGDGL